MTGRSPVPVVLVADDDVELRDAVTGILETSGFGVLLASDGVEALERALSCDVDIVLLDQNMPRKSGVEVWQALQEAGFVGPIIISSGVEVLGGPSGATRRWLKKPFDADQLLGAVRQALTDGALESAPVAPPIRQPLLLNLLSRAEEALALQQSGVSYTRHAQLGDLCERLQSLDEDMIRRVDEASAPFQQTLEHVVEAAQRRTRQNEALRIDLRTVLRGLRCMLDIALVDRGRLSLDRCCPRYQEMDLARLIRRVCRCFDKLARDRGIAFEVFTPEKLGAEADGEKLERVLLTLLFNAFKHTPLDGAVACRLEQDPHEGEVSLKVSDSGPKIPSGQEAVLFQHSRLLDRTTSLRDHDRVLDLCCARQLVALHGGTLTLSHRKKGCGFRATFPRWSPRGVAVADTPFTCTDDLATRAAEAAASELDIEMRLGPEEDTTPPARRRSGPARDGSPLVLIVEDSRSIQRILTECFTPELSTVSAFNGHDGLRLATELRPDLIVTDVGLPRMNGEEMIRHIRAKRELAEIPILVLAAAEDPLQGVRLLEADGQDVVRKPFLLAEVQARATRLLVAKRARDILNEAAGHKDPDLARLAGDVLHRRRTDEITLKQAHDSQATAELESRVKSGFLRMMAHELKTPITAMHLQMRLLEREAELAHSPSLQEGLVRIARSSNRLVQLIDTCIEWGRVESKRCHLATETFDLAPLVSEVVAEFQSHIERKGIQIDFVPDAVPSLSSDRKLARLALLNLVSYAVQNTDRGTVRVSVDAAEGFHRIWVTDGGAPIAEGRQQELFSPLQTNDDLRWQAGSGSGLGLYVVRDIVRAIGGDVVLHSTERSGNTFVLTLSGLPEAGANDLVTESE
jgi:signal transduction histidine kinase